MLREINKDYVQRQFGLSTGVKAPFELTRHAVAIKQQGIDFAIRHYSHHAGRNLSLAEARALTDAGIEIGAVWEMATHLNYFTRAQGCADGAAAYLMAQSVIGQPSGSAIYFAVGPEADEAGIAGPVARYFEGVNQAFSAARPDERQYQVGVYGSFACCEWMMARGLATLGWVSLDQVAPAVLPVDDGQRISVDLMERQHGQPAGFFWVL